VSGISRLVREGFRFKGLRFRVWECVMSGISRPVRE